MSELHGGPVVGEDGVPRCPWAAAPGLLRDYHDREWGVVVRGESALLERLTLEAFQSGLSWRTILAKRDAFRAAFADFDADRVADFDEGDRARLMADAGIVRNRAKIDAAIANARATVALRSTVDGGLDALLWSLAPDGSPAPSSADEVPATSPESTALAKTLKTHGFAFVGPTTAHALMEATGMIDTHLVGCHRRGCGRARSDPGSRPSGR